MRFSKCDCFHTNCGFLPLCVLYFCVFHLQALPIVQDLRNRNVMPVICGGTNYYIESLLWNVLVNAQGPGSDAKTTLEPVNKKVKVEEDDDLTNEELHAKLKSIDPERAKDLHPNERRKISRSLQVFREEGKKFAHWGKNHQFIRKFTF